MVTRSVGRLCPHTARGGVARREGLWHRFQVGNGSAAKAVEAGRHGGSQPVSLSRQAGLKRPAAIALATAAMTALAMATAGNALAGPSGARSDTPTLYLVQVAGDPLATYAGGVSNIPGTKPADGQKLRPRAWNYAAYRDYLKARRAEVLRRAGVDAKKAVVSYDTVFNGFAAKLTSAEVAKLRHTKGIVNVWKNQIIKVDTVTTPRFLGLDGPGGVWQRQFGDVSRAGEGVIVGVVDSGFWPESPSFAPLSEPRPDQAIIDEKWSGTCVTGNTGPVTCNNKVIGARFYRVSQPELANPNEFDSPRDLHGHGSHTASTAAGDNGVPMSINGLAVGNGSGMAPAARLAIYKALWTTADGTSASGGFIDLMNAIDDAVADGVDVINYSISGSLGTITDPVEIAFLNAAVAGVFVSASAGNSGPAAGTVAHTAPWETTVAASTHDRSSTKRVTLGNGASYVGAGVGPAMPAAPFMDAANAALAGANPLDAARCFVGSLDPAKVTGKGVLCLRGTNPRTEKSRAVKVAGGVAMILYNASPAVDGVLGADPGAGARGRRLLLARSRPCQRRRPGQARHRRAGCRRDCLRVASGPQQPRRQPVQLVQRHLDGRPAHRGHRGADPQQEPDLVTHGDQVGADDHRRHAGQLGQPDRQGGRRQRHAAGLRRRSRPGPERVRPGSDLRVRPDRVAPVRLWHRGPDLHRRPQR